MGAEHQKPFAPLLPDQILRQPIGEHGAGRRDMHDIAAAFLLAQNIVAGADVEDQRLGGQRRIGDLDQGFGGQVGKNEFDALSGQIGKTAGGVFARLELFRHQLEILVHKFAGDSVVVHADLRARLAVIGARASAGATAPDEFPRGADSRW